MLTPWWLYEQLKLTRRFNAAIAANRCIVLPIWPPLRDTAEFLVARTYFQGGSRMSKSQAVGHWLRLALCLVIATLIAVPAATGSVTFSTFVSSSSISALLGNTSTIGYTYAGNKFVGSVYFGPNNNQLYSTDLTGGSLALFGSPIPGFSGEIALGSSLGLGGFPSRDVYAGSQAGTSIYHLPNSSNSGTAPNLFVSLPGGAIRGITFDQVGTFGGNMLVSTSSGQIFSVASNGSFTQLANLGQDSEGMAIGTSSFGPFAGYLLVGSEGSGQINAINPTTHAVTLVTTVASAEVLSSVPLNLGSGGPLEGFYAANYPVDIINAGASQFAGLQGDLVVTGETTGQMTDVHWNGSTFVSTNIGAFPNQPEDGEFVTQAIINPTPEPGTILMVGTGLVGLAGALRRKRTR
jgi:PEP-CTERM motif